MSRPTATAVIRPAEQTPFPDDFAKAVALHLFRNLHPRPDTGTPLILGVHGPWGEGKTFLTLALLQNMGVEVIQVSGGLLESPDAGRPAEVIREAYEKASLTRAKHGVAAALVINDIDTAVGNWGANVQTTVNRQIVLEEFMNLADQPTAVEGRPVHRSPIILTGNDFTKLYGPLTRHGRMAVFAWKPGPPQKVPIVHGMFPELSRAECGTVVDAFRHEPISFYAQLRHALREDVIWQYLQSGGVRLTLQQLLEGRAPILRDALTVETLIHAGRQLQERHRFVNHLEA